MGLVALSFGLAYYAQANTSYSYSPGDTFVNPLIARPGSGPRAKVDLFMNNLDSFPKSGFALGSCFGKHVFTLGQSPTTYPKSYHRIERVTLSRWRSLSDALLNDDPKFGVDIKMVVGYEDGDECRFNATATFYGSFLGFAALPGGDCIPGNVQLVGQCVKVR